MADKFFSADYIRPSTAMKAKSFSQLRFRSSNRPYLAVYMADGDVRFYPAFYCNIQTLYHARCPVRVLKR